MVATSHGSRHVLKAKQFKLPEKVLRDRWKKARKVYEKPLKYRIEYKGLGTWDKFGRELMLPCRDEPRVVIRRYQRISLKPLASTYLVRGRNTMEHARWLIRLTSLKSFRCAYPKARAKNWRRLLRGNTRRPAPWLVNRYGGTRARP
jgi:hypothetical protein